MCGVMLIGCDVVVLLKRIHEPADSLRHYRTGMVAPACIHVQRMPFCGKPYLSSFLCWVLVLQLFDRWCTDDKNCVLIPGYSVEGTLAKKLLSSPDEVAGMDGRVRQHFLRLLYLCFFVLFLFLLVEG